MNRNWWKIWIYKMLLWYIGPKMNWKIYPKKWHSKKLENENIRTRKILNLTKSVEVFVRNWKEKTEVWKTPESWKFLQEFCCVSTFTVFWCFFSSNFFCFNELMFSQFILPELQYLRFLKFFEFRWTSSNLYLIFKLFFENYCCSICLFLASFERWMQQVICFALKK